MEKKDWFSVLGLGFQLLSFISVEVVQVLQVNHTPRIFANVKKIKNSLAMKMLLNNKYVFCILLLLSSFYSAERPVK